MVGQPARENLLVRASSTPLLPRFSSASVNPCPALSSCMASAAPRPAVDTGRPLLSSHAPSALPMLAAQHPTRVTPLGSHFCFAPAPPPVCCYHNHRPKAAPLLPPLLRSIPPAWHLPPALVQLDLDNNLLSGELPLDWPLPPSLEELCIFNNTLKGVGDVGAPALEARQGGGGIWGERVGCR